ncbi:class I SAM-dependent RNA methyltransferase [Candidatus Nephthysia bennettiae]|uniref:Class I SAM-dependent RNA methyltransferase n=1 Tax=Candidatus Nephthysia bennettiae TaxID=3127016 RepID=A0A934K682_9BACT|nr:class I SAM-dependent RNA methyltransferase [Candidatus Dormibacteraeota bacterium]MBJ7614440.1 class I SAM-dependent RNA methyltransferase [Candidatus Dormibacteraeota bacterium]
MIVRGEAPAHGGAVIGHDEGRAVLIYYALPGELVEAAPRGRQGGLVAARTERVLEPSPDRVEARCPHFGECGGCHWQHSRYQRQLELKREVVEHVWRGAGLRLPADTPVLGMEVPWRYRIRGEFEASYRPGQPVELGFHRQRSHSVLPIRTCPIHDERIERAMLAFRQAASEVGVSGLKTLLLTVEPTGKGLLWRARRQGPGGRDVVTGLGQRVAELLPDLVLLDDSMNLEFWDLAFRVRSDTFVQTNYKQMLVLYQVALDMVGAGPGDSVLDLYAGIGTLGIPLARSARAVTAIEENPAAVQLSHLNSRINRTPNFRTLPGRVETALRQVRMGDHQAAILDPPRAGCDPAALAELLRLSPERLVYVSCEPSTHARDIAMLVRGGYRLRRAAVVDMFPQTYHVETVALLERSAP